MAQVDGSPILRLPQELLSSIIDYVPKTQWPSLELVNRSFRDAVYSSWQSVKEFDIDKDVLGIHQSAKGVRLSDYLSSFLAKLLLRSPMLTSIIGFPEIDRDSDEAKIVNQSEILHIISQFTNLKRIDFGASGIKYLELVELLTSSASRDRLVEINSSIYNQTDQYEDQNLPAIYTARENSVSHALLLKLEKLSLKNLCRDETFYLDQIIDLIDPSSLTVLVLENITAPSDYLQLLITNCNHLQQLQFSFMAECRCKESPCVHLTSTKQILESIQAMECLDSLKIGMTGDIESDQAYLEIEDDLPVLIERLGWRGRLVEFGLLYWNYCSDEVIEGIGQHLTGLKSLEIFAQRCRPAALVDMIKKMVNLEKLAFSITFFSEWDDGITSEVLQSVARHLLNLRSFNLWSPHDFYCLAVLTRLEHLEELCVIDQINPNANWESTFGHQLQSLELQNCNEELVTTYLKQVSGLRRLVLGGCFPFSNEVLQIIPTTCPGLREFSVPQSLATKEGIQAVIDGCPELEKLRC